MIIFLYLLAMSEGLCGWLYFFCNFAISSVADLASPLPYTIEMAVLI
jgi:hypothetical protein|tara:strand:- start:503 stop:643 length:141 start_codon:yes stop_codon:yes gene_type:complete